MPETLEQIRKLIVDGKFLEALNMIDESVKDCHELVSKCNQLEKEKMAMLDTIEELNQIANASKKVERDADDSKTMENLRKMLEDECSRRCVLEKKLDIAIYFLKKYANVNLWQDCRLYDGDDEEYVKDACYFRPGYEEAQEALEALTQIEVGKMTWDELKEKTSDFKYTTDKDNIIFCCNMCFCKDGKIFAGDLFGGEYNVSENRTPAQMYSIMKALQ